MLDAHGKPIKTEKSDEEKAAEAKARGERQLQVGRLRTGHLLLAFLDAANKRLGALGYMRQLEMQKQMEKMVTDPPELKIIYDEVTRLEAEVVGLVTELNTRFAGMDDAMSEVIGEALYTNTEFFGRSMEQAPEGGEA